jgi:general stress protein YciG
MAGTKAGGLKAKATILRSNPNHFRDIGKKGGSAEVPKGFALMDGFKHSELSAKGGRAVRKKKTEE